MNDVGIAGGRIRSFVERIEHIEAEVAELNEGKKEVLAEAKGEGFDVKVIKEIIKLRKQDKDERRSKGAEGHVRRHLIRYGRAHNRLPCGQAIA